MNVKWAQAVVIGFILAMTVLVWAILLVGIWFHPMGDDAAAYEPESSLMLGAGTLLTALGTATAAALGFGVSDVKKKQDGDNKGVALKFVDTAKTIGFPAIAGFAVYALLGVVIALTTWLPIGAGGFEAMRVFALSVVGWVVGAFALIK